MARLAKNKLTIEPTQDDKGQPSGFRLFGFFNGKKIRKVSKDLNALEALRASLEHSQQALDAAEQARETQRSTWLSIDQIRDAEAAIRARGDQVFALLDYVNKAKPLMGGPVPKLADEALSDWLVHQADRGRFSRTLDNNKYTVGAFLKFTKVKFVGEISSEIIDRYISQPGLKVGTKVARGSQIKAWLNFCLRKKWLRANPCELQLDEMIETATRLREKDRILTVAQCEALLQAACEHRNGYMVPYVILACWCFMRTAEVRHTLTGDIRLSTKPGVKSTVLVTGRKEGVGFRVVNIPENVVALLKSCVAHGVLKEGQAVPFSIDSLDTIREAAGLMKFHPKTNNKNRKVLSSVWKESILRHTGESYLYQKTGDVAFCTAQAGHSKSVAFKHYLQLPQEGDCDKFYAITGQLAPAAPAKIIPMEIAS